jgi:hypothetical protein
MTNQGSVFTCREGVSFQPPLTGSSVEREINCQVFWQAHCQCS